jgi:hypothetical protein
LLRQTFSACWISIKYTPLAAEEMSKLKWLPVRLFFSMIVSPVRLISLMVDDPYIYNFLFLLCNQPFGFRRASFVCFLSFSIFFLLF